MRARVVAALLTAAVLLAACGEEPAPPVVEASEVEPTRSASPTADPDEARLAELRATDQFDEFAEHERAAQADGARLAWENFAPIVDGKRVEWTNKAELWDSIAPKIRDEALLLGPEYRKPLWDQRNAIPNSVAASWNDQDTNGRGHYFEFLVTYSTTQGAAQRIWGVLVQVSPHGAGEVVARRMPVDFPERQFGSSAQQEEVSTQLAWRWVTAQGGKR